LTLTVKNDALVIPESALLLSGARVTVFVVGAENKVDIRAVTTGTRLAGIVEITTGLKPGEKVVVEGLQKVRPGAVVSLAPESSMAPYRKSPTDRNQAPKL
ncbi:MAG TPA: hypothetical protein VK968_00540, partial [Roseimicrobium sp.]|nr:hypothetical protein [Roseimicrobium sp.]